MDGASFTEQLIGAVRGNNEEFITEKLKTSSNPSDLVNNTKDPVGNTLLYVASVNGSYDVLYCLLDNDNIEIDCQNKMDGNTPLHGACIYAAQGSKDVGKAIVDLLIECGSSLDIRNENGKIPLDLASASNLQDIVNSLRGASYALEIGEAVDGDGALDDEDLGVDEEPSDDGEDVE